MVSAMLLALLHPALSFTTGAPRVLPTILHANRPACARTQVSAALRDDLRAVGTAALCSAVLFMSPMAAHAKGGGHGGGGGGGGGGGHSSSHSSHSSSRSYTSGSYGSSSSSRRTLQTKSPISYTKAGASSSRSSRSRRSSSYSSNDYSYSSYSTAAPPSPPLLFPDEDTARRENGYFCPANMPKVGERVDIAPDMGTRYRTATVISNQPALQSSLYPEGDGKLQATPGFENADCTLLVRYDDDGTTATVSAAEKPTPYWEMVALPLTYGGLIAAAAVDGSEGQSVWDNDREEHYELLKELAATTDGLRDDARLPAESRQIQRPVSGEYWGASEETDEGDQAVRTTLKFSADGKISGRGKDGVDGAYRITSGRWGVNTSMKRPTVAWVEDYDEGFKVVVSGTYEPRTGKIKASFTSSRNVRGGFELAPKPEGF